MNLGQKSKPLDLIDYNDQLRDQILDALRARAVLPEVYGILVWSVGYLGLHRWYTGSYLLAALQLILFLLMGGLTAKMAMDVSFDPLPIVVILGVVVVGWWFGDLATQRHAVVSAQFAKEQALLSAIKSHVQKK